MFGVWSFCFFVFFRDFSKILVRQIGELFKWNKFYHFKKQEKFRDPHLRTAPLRIQSLTSSQFRDQDIQTPEKKAKQGNECHLILSCKVCEKRDSIAWNFKIMLFVVFALRHRFIIRFQSRQDFVSTKTALRNLPTKENPLKFEYKKKNLCVAWIFISMLIAVTWDRSMTIRLLRRFEVVCCRCKSGARGSEKAEKISLFI